MEGLTYVIPSLFFIFTLSSNCSLAIILLRQFLLKALCTGSVQSFFAMLYNFPARMTIAHKAPKHQQIFSQRDMEGAFEAYLGVCMGYVGMEEVLLWFEKLLSPWISAYIPAAQQLQRERDVARASRLHSRTNQTDQWRSFRFERRAAQSEEVGTLGFIKHPTLKVSTAIPRFLVILDACDRDRH
jgi:dsRNA-specific ribonuclease